MPSWAALVAAASDSSKGCPCIYLCTGGTIGHVFSNQAPEKGSMTVAAADQQAQVFLSLIKTCQVVECLPGRRHRIPAVATELDVYETRIFDFL